MTEQTNWTLYLTGFGIALLILALVINFRKPKDQRIKWTVPGVPEGKERLYAPLYTKQDRIKQVKWLLIGSVPLYLMIQFLFTPWFQNMDKNMCHEWMGMDGLSLTFHGLMLVLYVVTLWVLWLFARQISKIKQAGQFPLPGQKTIHLTKIQYGKSALTKPVLGLACATIMLILTVTAHLLVNKLIDQNMPKIQAKCQAQKINKE